MHLAIYTFVTRIYVDLGDTMDDHIASALTFRSLYWPEALVKGWLAERWRRWMQQADGANETAPVWFDLHWRSLIPLDFLPEELREAERAWRTEAEAEEAAARAQSLRAGHRLIQHVASSTGSFRNRSAVTP